VEAWRQETFYTFRSQEIDTMIHIIGPNSADSSLDPYGKCCIKADGEGWYQRHEGHRVFLNVQLAQTKSSWLSFGRRNHRPIKAMVDTGCWYNIINSETFSKLGFSVSSNAAGDLGIAGLVSDSTGRGNLWGWCEEVRLSPARMNGLALPSLPVKMHVATNFKMDAECLVGLEFLRKYTLILKDELIVLDGK